MPKVYNKYKDIPPKDAVYIGRPSKWGNPFVIGKDGDRDEVILKYICWLEKQTDILEQVHELKGKDLICFCSPEKCHGDILLELSNKL